MKSSASTACNSVDSVSSTTFCSSTFSTDSTTTTPPETSTPVASRLCPSFCGSCSKVETILPNSLYCASCTHLYLCDKYKFPKRGGVSYGSPRLPAMCTREELKADLQLVEQKVMRSKLQSLLHTTWPASTSTPEAKQVRGEPPTLTPMSLSSSLSADKTPASSHDKPQTSPEVKHASLSSPSPSKTCPPKPTVSITSVLMPLLPGSDRRPPAKENCPPPLDSVSPTEKITGPSPNVSSICALSI